MVIQLDHKGMLRIHFIKFALLMNDFKFQLIKQA